MTDRVALRLGGETLHLLADRAVHWPAQDLLLVADLHLGKGDVFRAHGIAVPSGGTAHDLDRLARLLQATGAGTLVVLGDFVHARERDPRWLARWRVFRDAWRDVRIALVAGNHDAGLDIAPLGIERLPACVRQGVLHLVHDAADAPAPSLSGHVHPVLRLPGEARPLPAFWERGGRLVLPAFSAFTGGHRVAPAPGDRLCVCNGDAIVAVTALDDTPP